MAKFIALVSVFFFSVWTSAEEEIPLLPDEPVIDKAPTSAISKRTLSTIEERISSMSLEQKVGQVFIFGFSSTTMDKKLQHVMEIYKPGGVIIFGRNVKTPLQIARLNHDLERISKQQSGIPILKMVDQEGGSVSRIRTRPMAPSALALGITEDNKLISETGEVIGQILKLLGFNMNLAPVLDI
ncbi:MAG: glycoside hydrolase family 3 protein, partial [Bdellovibrionales bacterium]|nr:glycoside hydrolase family 3 protein [Bdellovibrionales bacterium]